MKVKILLIFLVLALVSCRPSYFTKLENLESLNGKYYSKSLFKYNGKKKIPDTKAHMLRFFNSEKNLETVNWVEMKFQEPDKVELTYPVMELGEITTKKQTFTGKRRRNYLKVTHWNEDIFIPLIYGNTQKNYIKIGKTKENQLLIQHYYENTGNILILAGGVAYTSDFVFEKYDKYAGNKAFYKDGKYGIKRGEKEIVPAIYDIAYTYKDEYIKVKINDKYGILDYEGREIVPVKYDDIEYKEYEINPVFYVKNMGKMGLVNMKGEEFVPIRYDKIKSYNNKFYELHLNNKQGLANLNGVLYPAIYENLGWSSVNHNRYFDAYDEYIAVKRDSTDYLIDTRGYEYQVNKKIPKFGGMASIYPLLETARKVSLDEEAE